MLPAYADNASTHVFPAVRPDPARSVGYPVDPAAATIESAAVAPVSTTSPSSNRAREVPRSTRAALVMPTLATPAPTAPDTGAAVAKHGAVMALGSITSRVTGFVRTAAIGAAIGAAAIGNDYSLANTLPGMVYELLLGGVLASVVVPLLVRARTRDADRGEAYAQRLLSLAVIFLAGATVVAVRLRAAVHRAARQRPHHAGRPRPDHHAVVPAAAHDLLLRHGGPVRGGAEHPRSLRDADVRPDPEQPRRHRDGRRSCLAPVVTRTDAGER